MNVRGSRTGRLPVQPNGCVGASARLVPDLLSCSVGLSGTAAARQRLGSRDERTAPRWLGFASMAEAGIEPNSGPEELR